MNVKKSYFFINLIIITFPFLLFYWMVPFISSLTIGSDYLLMLKMQRELLFSIKTGSFPLYVPGFAGGHSSSAVTLAQLFHPISHLASILPGYWHGKVIEWNNFLKLLSLGFAQLVLFIFLRRLKLNTLFSFLITFITVYNLRILDLYRYGPALEAYTAFFFLCTAIGWYFIRSSKWSGPLCIIGATYLLICSGHPQMMYYGLLGAGLFTFVAPFFLSDILCDREIDYSTAIKFWLKVGCLMVLGIILSSAFILTFYFDFISVNIDRVRQDYMWANSDLDSFIGTINNFFLPLSSEVHSAFGGSSLILMVATLPLLRLFGIKIPRYVWVTWCIFLIVFLYMQGKRTPIHKLVWEYMPFASSMRVPGRISIIMPFFIMILLIWIIKADSILKKFNFLKPLTIMAFTSCVITAIYYLIYFSGSYIFNSQLFLKYYNPFYFSDNFLYISPSFTYFRVQLFLVILGLISLISLILYSQPVSIRSAKIFGTILVITTLLQVGIALRYRAVNFSANLHSSPSFKEMQEQKKNKLDYRYYPAWGMHSSIVTTQLKNSFMEPFLGKIFTDIIPVETQDEAYERMRRMRLPQQVFIEGYDTLRAEEITEGARSMKEGHVELIYSSFNRLEFRIYSEAPAIFGLSYPYTGHWRAWVNGEKVKVYRANGASHAVEIPEGESIVEFRYWSNAYFWGMMVSCMTFALIGVFVGLKRFRGLRKTIIVIVAIAIGAGTFMLWYKSLYNGENLETRYTWIYTPPLQYPNLAYGKKNWTNVSTVHVNLAYREMELYSSRIVDGDHSHGSGFITCFYDNPAWFVDLSRTEKFEKILLYYSNKEALPPFMILKNCSIFEDEIREDNGWKVYDILISNDGDNWEIIDSVKVENNGSGIKEVHFQGMQIARFIQIRLRGRGQLTFDEVEIYTQ